MNGIPIKRILITAAFVAAGLTISAVASAQTASTTPSNIAFPIAELGNCTDRDSCHAYCNIPANMQACTAFAQSHGLESSGDVQKAEQFAKLIKSGKGPGGCTSPDSCNAYCSTIKNLNACISFAKTNGLTDSSIVQGEKLQIYLGSGGHTPGDCGSRDACEAYCSNQSHMQECMTFAKAVGLPMGEGGPGGPNSIPPAMQQKFSQLLQANKTPGGCTTLNACLTYCNDPSHGSECESFGQAMGADNGQMQVRGEQGAQNGIGPGGCNSDASCRAYCADPAHAAECAPVENNSHYVQMSPTGTPNGECGIGQYWNGSECIHVIGSSTNGIPYGAHIMMNASGTEQGIPGGDNTYPCQPGVPCNPPLNQQPIQYNNTAPCAPDTPCSATGTQQYQQPQQQQYQPCQPDTPCNSTNTQQYPPQSSASGSSYQANIINSVQAFIGGIAHALSSVFGR